MNDLLLKNYELLSHIKNEYDKLVEENKSLKLQGNQNINTITPNNTRPKNVDKCEKKHDNDSKKNVDECEARLFSGGYNIENMTQCDKKKIVNGYCVKHSKELLYGNINIENTDGWKGHTQPHSKGFIKNMNEYFVNGKGGCYARVIIEGNGGYFNFKRCNCQKVNENYCSKHIINLKDGDVRYVGSKYFPFHYQQYSNIKVSHGEKGWTKKMEELFPKIYFTGDNILDLNKYDIYGNDIYS